jgi:hypothetical protein
MERDLFGKIIIDFATLDFLIRFQRFLNPVRKDRVRRLKDL